MATASMTSRLSVLASSGERGSETTNKPKQRPIWMTDEQYSIYLELVSLTGSSLDSLVARDREAWTKIQIRLRDMARLAADKMFC